MTLKCSMLEETQVSLTKHLRKIITSRYQFSDNNNNFYLHPNFRHTIQYVHNSEARMGHLGRCSP